MAALVLTACSPADTAPPSGQTEAAAAGSDAAADKAAAVEPSTGSDEASAPRGRQRGPQSLGDMQARLDRGFARADADGDGVVTTAELDALATEGGRGGRMLARADADEDGRITRDEVRAAAAAMIARLDVDGDGVVTPEERPAWSGRGGERP
jgi:hypothetical protein